MYITGSETIANINNDIKASNESTNRQRIAIHYTGYSECSAVLYEHNVMFCRIANNNQLVNYN